MRITALALIWAFLALISLGVGQYGLSVVEVANTLFGHGSNVQNSVIFGIRIPRVLLSSLCGGALGLAGLTLQAVFKNPLVGPGIIGVSSASAFGGALAILFSLHYGFVFSFTFICGVIALASLYAMAKFLNTKDIFSLILSGIIINGIFSALVGLVQYLADSETTLPNIVFWLLGSFVRADYEKVMTAAMLMAPCIIIIILMRWRLNLLSMSDIELKILGIRLDVIRFVLLVLSTLLIATQVSVSGSIGYVGLVVPHITRFIVGNNHLRSAPASFIVGAIFMLVVDDLSRNIATSEIPLSILTALIASPVFIYLLKKSFNARNY